MECKEQKLPIQVYLEVSKKEQFDQITEKLHISKSKLLRSFINDFIEKHKGVLEK